MGAAPDSPHLDEEAQRKAGDSATADARATPRPATRATRVAVERASGALRLLRRALQLPGARELPLSRSARLATLSTTAKPARTVVSRTAQAVRGTVRSSASAHHASAPKEAVRRPVDRRWGPGAGNPLAGFCPGGGPKGPSLPGQEEHALSKTSTRDAYACSFSYACSASRARPRARAPALARPGVLVSPWNRGRPPVSSRLVCHQLPKRRHHLIELRHARVL